MENERYESPENRVISIEPDENLMDFETSSFGVEVIEEQEEE